MNNRTNCKKRHCKVVTILLSMMIALSLFPASVFAGTNGHSQQDAVNWATARGNERWAQDVDGAYGCQCVDLILAYYRYLTGSNKSGNACDYRSNALPAGWTRVYGSPQAGDVVVWGPGAKMGWSPLSTEYANSTYGHIGIVWRVNSGGTISTIETNTLTGAAAAYKERYASTAACYIRPDFVKPHTHSYSSSVTKQPTCTAAGVKTFRCSCGSSYTESIPAKGHSYINTVVAPTTTSDGYTKHVCSVCGSSYTDNYTDRIREVDGWMVGSVLPSGVTSSKYEIQYKNYYEKIQTSSPGSGWTNAGVYKTEWKNSGSRYTSATDLATSDSRVLVASVFYHFCGPTTGAEGNYEQTSKFVHWDSIDASRVTSKYLGTDNGHPYYFVYLNGQQLYCHSGTTCDGSYGTHGNRCKAWYKQNTYQDRVKVTTYKFTKESGWTTSKDSSATRVTYRYRLKETPKPVTPVVTPVEPDENDVDNGLGNEDYEDEYYDEYDTEEDEEEVEKPKPVIKPLARPAAAKIKTVKGAKKKLTVKWGRVRSNTKGYQVEIRKTSNGRKTFKTVKQSKNKTISLTVKKLKKGTYKVRVRAFNKGGGKTVYGKWSSAKRVKVK